LVAARAFPVAVRAAAGSTIAAAALIVLGHDGKDTGKIGRHIIRLFMIEGVERSAAVGL
jgi:hypothetical protein